MAASWGPHPCPPTQMPGTKSVLVPVKVGCTQHHLLAIACNSSSLVPSAEPVYKHFMPNCDGFGFHDFSYSPLHSLLPAYHSDHTR